jgi:hypothetical protein
MLPAEKISIDALLEKMITPGTRLINYVSSLEPKK